MRRVFAAMIVAMALAGCEQGRNAVIPQDPTTWEKELAPKLKGLSEEERRLFAAYIARVAMENSFAGKEPIPAGLKVGQVIDLQRKHEATAGAAGAASSTAQAQAAAIAAAAAAKLNGVATVTLADMQVLSPDYDAGRYESRVMFIVTVINKSQKQIAGIKGTMHFDDQFGEPIKMLSLSMDDDIGAGQTKVISDYGFDLNQFMDDDQRLANTPFSKMKTKFVPEMIVFADGTKVTNDTP